MAGNEMTLDKMTEDDIIIGKMTERKMTSDEKAACQNKFNEVAFF